jgi:hypothetical protein
MKLGIISLWRGSDARPFRGGRTRVALIVCANPPGNAAPVLQGGLAVIFCRDPVLTRDTYLRTEPPIGPSRLPR